MLDELHDDSINEGQRTVWAGGLESATRARMSNVTNEKEQQFKLSMNQYANLLTQSISEKIQ